MSHTFENRQVIPVQPEQVPAYLVLSLHDIRKLARAAQRTGCNSRVKPYVVLHSKVILGGSNHGQFRASEIRINSPEGERL